MVFSVVNYLSRYNSFTGSNLCSKEFACLNSKQPNTKMITDTNLNQDKPKKIQKQCRTLTFRLHLSCMICLEFWMLEVL